MKMDLSQQARQEALLTLPHQVLLELSHCHSRQEDRDSQIRDTHLILRSSTIVRLYLSSQLGSTHLLLLCPKHLLHRSLHLVQCRKRGPHHSYSHPLPQMSILRHKLLHPYLRPYPHSSQNQAHPHPLWIRDDRSIINLQEDVEGQARSR